MNPDILNMIVNTITRDIVVNYLDKKSFNSDLLFKILYTCVGFTTYFIFTKKILINPFSSDKLMKTFNSLNKFGTMLIVKSLLEKKINKDVIQKIIFTLIGIAVYHLVVEDYLDNFSILEKRLLFFITKDFIVSLLNSKSYNIYDFEDSIGITLYHILIKKLIFFK